MIIVSDTTSLSELSKIGKLDLLEAIFGRVIITQQVYEELTTGNHPAVAAVKSALWLEVISVSNTQLIEKLQLETDLDLGECSAVLLICIKLICIKLTSHGLTYIKLILQELI